MPFGALAGAAALVVVEVAGRRIRAPADVDAEVRGGQRRLVARADDLQRPVDEPEHGDGEDVVGVEVAGMGGDDGHERARNASCCSTACAHSRSSRSPPTVMPKISCSTSAKSSALEHDLRCPPTGR